MDTYCRTLSANGSYVKIILILKCYNLFTLLLYYINDFLCRKASWARLGIKNIHDKVGLDRRIVQHVVHQHYKPPSRYNDIALFRLEYEVHFSESIKPICLNSDQLLNPETQIATGWGRTATGWLHYTFKS